MAYAVLGPAGTFSEEAAIMYWGSEVILKTAINIPELFTMVETGKVAGAIVPLDNTLAGSINATIEALESKSVKIVGEISIPITQHLLARKHYKPAEIELLISHPAALLQCEPYIKQNMKNIRTEITCSTAAAAQIVIDEPKKAAVIGSQHIAQIYKLKIIQENIAESNNITRFVHISKTSLKSGRNKSSILITLEDNPGSLYHSLGLFAQRNVNMCKIDSRPSRGKNGQYSFYIEINTPLTDKQIDNLLTELNNCCTAVKYLGSYDVYNGSRE